MRCCILLMFLAAIPAYASWAAVDVEILVDHAELVVVGRVVRLEAAGAGKEYAVIKVGEVLKDTAPPAAGKPPRALVKLRQAAKGGMMSSATLRYDVGKSGAWILTRDAAGGYRLGHPSAYVAKPDTLAALVAARKAIKGGAAVGGLVARAELVSTKTGTGMYHRVRFSLQNTSKAAIVVCVYPRRKPLTVDWTGPGGGKLESAHYQILGRIRMGEESRRHFVSIAPGRVRHVGVLDYTSFIGFSTAKISGTNQVGPGTHKIVVGFASTVDGKRFGLKTWNGSVNAPVVTLTVK